MVDSLHDIIPLIPRASYLGLPYLSIMEFYFINVQAVPIHMAVDKQKLSMTGKLLFITP